MTQNYYRLGGIICASGLTLLLYQAVGSLMQISTGKPTWNSLKIIDVADAKYLQWIDNVTIFSVHGIAEKIFDVPVSALLFGMSLLLFIAGYFSKR